MKAAEFDPAMVPYRQTPEYLAALERAERDRRRMRHRVGVLTAGELAKESAARDRKLRR